MYPDLGENVSQLVRAMTQRQPSESSLRKQPSPSLSLHENENTPTLPSLNTAFISDHTVMPPGDSPILVDTEYTPRLGYSSETAHPTPAATTSTFSPLTAITATERNDRRPSTEGRAIAKAISETEKAPAAMPITSPPYVAGNAKTSPANELERRRDFEARIAQATAQLQQTPITQVQRRPSVKGSAINIGSPTLINSSAKLNVTPLPIAQANKGKSPPVAYARHTRHQSSSAINAEVSNESKGIKGFMAKIKRNASLAERKRAKTPSSSPQAAQGSFQPMTALSSNDHSMDGVDMSPPLMSPPKTTPETSTKANISFPVTRQGSQKHNDPSASRKSVVRRTIIFATSNNENIPEPMPNIEALPTAASSPARRPSTRRKPVRHLSGDTDLLRAEGLMIGPGSQSISQVVASGSTIVHQRRPSEADSLYDMYANSADQHDEQDLEEVIYSGARASFGDNRPGMSGPSRSTKPRAIEIR